MKFTEGLFFNVLFLEKSLAELKVYIGLQLWKSSLETFHFLMHIIGGGQMLYITTSTFMLGLCLFVAISLNHSNWVLCVFHHKSCIREHNSLTSTQIFLLAILVSD